MSLEALDPARVNAWRIERQLLGKVRGATPEEVATTLVGPSLFLPAAAATAR